MGLLPGTAMAQDSKNIAVVNKTYHALSCQETNHSEVSSINRSEYRITNKGSASKTVLCPIEPGMQYWRAPVYTEYQKQIFVDGKWISDTSSRYSYSTPGFRWGDVLTVDVNVSDNHRTKDLTCHLMSRNEFGSAIQTDTDKTSGSAGHDVLELDVDLRSNATYLLKCELPHNDTNGYTKIFSYTVKQIDE
jgi:hypothetical protein